MTTLRCLVADDHPALLFAVCDLLAAAGYEVVGPATNGEEAVAVAERVQPELAVVDYRMPRLAGGELIRRLREVSPETRVAVYTAEADEAVVADVLEAGGAAVVLKEAPLDDLVRALASVRVGRPYVDPALARDTVLRQGNRRGGPALTVREVEVLKLLAEGLTHDEIGERLSISGETVRTHVRKASDRLDAATRTQAVATALRLGIIS